MGLESNDSLKNWVIGEVITADQYQQITGTLYSF
ncbi:XkdX family protein [Fructobacillus sp. M1-13]|nr:XkdX family protein [Fructobacillus papyriferae]